MMYLAIMVWIRFENEIIQHIKLHITTIDSRWLNIRLYQICRIRDIHGYDYPGCDQSIIYTLHLTLVYQLSQIC